RSPIRRCRSFATGKRKIVRSESVCVPGTTEAWIRFNVACALPCRDDRASQFLTRYGIFSMSQWLSTPALDEVAQKWRALAERRRAHFVELYHSGRWKR